MDERLDERMQCGCPPHPPSVELPNIAAYAIQDVHVWSALLTCMQPIPRCPTNRGAHAQTAFGPTAACIGD